MLREMRTLFRWIGGGIRFYILLFLRSPFEAARTVAYAVFLQNAFGTIADGDSRRLTLVCLLYGVASILLFLYNGTVWSIYAPFVTRMEGRLRRLLFSKIASFSYAHIEATPQSEWVTRLNTDVQMPFSRPIHLPHAACAIVNIGVSAVILWNMNPRIFGWIMLFVVPHILFSQLFIARTMPQLQQKSLEATAQNTGELTAMITCADIAVLYDAQGYLLKRFERSSLLLRRANMRIRHRNALSAAVLPLFGMGGYLTLLIAGSAWIAEGSLTFGELTAAFQYRGGVLIGAMMLINSLISINASIAGIQRINRTLSEKAEEQNG